MWSSTYCWWVTRPSGTRTSRSCTPRSGAGLTTSPARSGTASPRRWARNTQGVPLQGVPTQGVSLQGVPTQGVPLQLDTDHSRGRIMKLVSFYIKLDHVLVTNKLKLPWLLWNMQLYLFSIAYLRLLWCVHQNESDIYMSKMILIIIFTFIKMSKDMYNKQLSDKFWWLNCFHLFTSTLYMF